MALVVGSLRARHRAEVRRVVHRALLELSDEIGYAHVTVEALSARAGISSRTFFNHFAGKESAALSDVPFELDAELRQDFLRGGIGAPGEVLVAAVELMLAQLERHAPDCQDVHAMFALAEAHPRILQVLAAQLDRSRQELAELVAARLAPDADPQLSGVIAALAVTAVRCGMQAWSREPADGGAADASPVIHVRRARALMADLVAPSS